MSSQSVYQQFARTSLLRWNRSKNYARYDMLPRMVCCFSRGVYGLLRLVQSWHPKNIYNIWQRATSYAPEAWRLGAGKITVQRTFARRLVLGYHCQHVTSPQLRKKYLRAPPTYRIKAFKRKASSDPLITGPPFTDSNPLPPVPYFSMLFSEIEKRLDTVLFRSCLVPSIYKARTLITKGLVRVEGTIVRSPGFEMEPGMMFSVEPKHLTWGLHPDWSSRLPSITVGQSEEEGSETAESAEDKEANAAAMREKWSKGELDFRLPRWAAPMVFMPAYLEVSFAACAGVYVRHPTAKPGNSEIPSPWDAMGGEMFQLFHEYWRPLIRKHRVRPVLPVGMKRNVWKRETDRQRDIGEGNALAIEHFGRVRQATAESDEAYIHAAPDAEQPERRRRVNKIRNLRQQRYIAGRLASHAVPLEKARLVPPNRLSRIRIAS